MHARADGQGYPLASVPTGGAASDYNAFEPMLELLVRRSRIMRAEKGLETGRNPGHDRDAVREAPLRQGVLPVIPPKSDRRPPVKCDYRA